VLASGDAKAEEDWDMTALPHQTAPGTPASALARAAVEGHSWQASTLDDTDVRLEMEVARRKAWQLVARITWKLRKLHHGGMWPHNGR
jgi:hypothetical protein